MTAATTVSLLIALMTRDRTRPLCLSSIVSRCENDLGSQFIGVFSFAPGTETETETGEGWDRCGSVTSSVDHEVNHPDSRVE